MALFGSVHRSNVFGVHQMSPYDVPKFLEERKFIDRLLDNLHLRARQSSISPSLVAQGKQIWQQWLDLTSIRKRCSDSDRVTIALVGKYTSLQDSYHSVKSSLEHAAMACARKLVMVWIDAEHLENATMITSPELYHKAWHELCTADGVIVPGGFDVRGTEGMVAAANWARTKPKPYLGICLGMQIAVMEYARNVCKIKDATSQEFSKTAEEKVVIFMPEIDKEKMGGTMRLGLRPTLFQPNTSWSKLRSLYGEVDSVNERHRHRYEVNPDYVERLSTAGMSFIGKDEKGVRMEIVELQDHPWFVGVQFHPEYLSRVLRPSPPYLGFFAASAGILDTVIAHSKDGINGLVNGMSDAQPNGIINGRKVSLSSRNVSPI